MKEAFKIYRKEVVVYEFKSDPFTNKRSLMKDNFISGTIAGKDNINLLFGDYIKIGSDKFYLHNSIDITEANGIKQYPATFYSEYYFAQRCIIEDEGATTFPYFGGVSDHINLIKLAFQKYGLTQFAFGTIEENGSLNIEYDNTKGLDGINKICEAFKMEWEYIDGVFNIKKRIGVDTSYRFEYGAGNGAYSVSLKPVENGSIVTRLIAKGGTINLPKDYTSTDTPKRLNLGNEVIDRNTDKWGIIPEVYINEDIYPRLIDKKVLSVDIPGDIEKATVWKLKLDIPFDLSAQYAPDQKPEVKFQTGDLTGEGFEIAENSWNKIDKTLQIIVKDQEGYKLPSQNRQPNIGDKFVLLNILMPYSPYVTDAISELRTDAQEKIKTISEPQFAPSIEADPKYIKENDINVKPGDGIVVIAGGNEIHIRIQEISYPFGDKRKMTFQLGNNVMYSYEEKVANDLNDITGEIQNIQRSVQNADRRGWRDAKETNTRLDGIEEASALFGTEGGQLTSSVRFEANINSNPNRFGVTEGKLQHFIYKENPTGGIWNIGAFEITLTEDVLYSIYAKCNKSNDSGIIYISKEKIDIEAQEGYYFFFLGTISSIFEHARSIKNVTGYTLITGGYLTGQIIQDAQQRLVIDLPNATITAREGAKIRGKIDFLNSNNEWEDAEVVIDEKATSAGSSAAQEEIGKIQIGGVNLVDNSKSITVAAGSGSNFTYEELAKVESGKEYVLSVDSIILNAGAFDAVTVFVYNFTTNISIVRFEFNVSNKRQEQVFRCPEYSEGSDVVILIYAGLWGATSGNSVTYNKIQLEYGNKATGWKLSPADQQKEINHGKLFLRGAGFGSNTNRQLILNNDGVNRAMGGRGINLITIRRHDLSIVDNLVYDTYGFDSEIQGLVNKLHSLDNSVIVTMTSSDSMMYELFNYDNLIEAIASCGGSGSLVPFSGFRIPYAFVGIPGIGKGNGIEVFSGNGATDPYAEISTQIINGIPSGMSSAASILAKQAQELADEAKARLTAMSSDGIISKEEKATLRNDKSQIDKEFVTYQQQANQYGVSISALQTAYDTLSTFLTSIVLIDQDTDFTFSPGQKDIYNKDFADYYSERTAFANLIAKKVADGAVDGIQIGGVNLFDNSGNFENEIKNWHDNGGGLTIDTSVKYNGYNTIRTTVGAGIHGEWCKLENDVEYCYFAMIKTSDVFMGNGSMPLHYHSGKDFQNQGKISVTKWDTTFKAGIWKLAYIIFKLTDDADSFWPFIYGGDGITVFNIAFLGLVRGNKPLSTWSSSLADQKAQSKAAAAAATVEAERKALGQSWSSGNILYPDPAFKNGFNGISAYSYSADAKIYRRLKLSDSPIIDSDYNIEIRSTNGGGSRLGGFSFGNMSRANAIFICRIIAKIPIGYSIAWASNIIGESCGGASFWATSVIGTERWEEYIVVTKCDPTGIFETTNYFHLTKQSGIPEDPVIWYLAYASVFDVTSGSNAQTEAVEAKLKAEEVNFLKNAFKSNVSLDNGVVMAGGIFVENSPGSNVISAGLAGYIPIGQTDYPMIFAGSNGATNANLAKFRVYKNGKIYASDAEITGRITATSGVIGRLSIEGGFLKNTSGSAAVVLQNENNTIGAIMGTSAVPASTGVSIPAYFYNKETNNGLTDNVALVIDASGARDYADVNKNIALLIKSGGIVMEKQGHIRLKANNNQFVVDGILKGATNEGHVNSYPLGTFLADTRSVSEGWATLRVRIR